MSSSDKAFFEACETDTLQNPTELWSVALGAGRFKHHFLRYFDSRGSFWYIVEANDTQNDEIEIVDSFPTDDADLLHGFRQGEAKILKARPE